MTNEQNQKKKKKVESRYTADIRRLATRMSPTRLCEAVRMMRNLKNDTIYVLV